MDTSTILSQTSSGPRPRESNTCSSRSPSRRSIEDGRLPIHAYIKFCLDYTEDRQLTTKSYDWRPNTLSILRILCQLRLKCIHECMWWKRITLPFYWVLDLDYLRFQYPLVFRIDEFVDLRMSWFQCVQIHGHYLIKSGKVVILRQPNSTTCPHESLYDCWQHGSKKEFWIKSIINSIYSFWIYMIIFDFIENFFNVYKGRKIILNYSSVSLSSNNIWSNLLVYTLFSAASSEWNIDFDGIAL